MKPVGASPRPDFLLKPFTRYYDVKADHQFNLFTDLSYQFCTRIFDRTSGAQGPYNKFKGTVGAELFVNTSIGIELTLGYKTLRGKWSEPSNAEDAHNGFLLDRYTASLSEGLNGIEFLTTLMCVLLFFNLRSVLLVQNGNSGLFDYVAACFPKQCYFACAHFKGIYPTAANRN